MSTPLARLAWVAPIALALCAGLSLSPARASGGAESGSGSGAATTVRPHRPSYVPPIRHVFIINIENKGYDETFGADTESPYLAGRLRRKGVLLNSYYATAHNSLPNYLAQISGQAPNAQTQTDCQTYSPFVRTGPGRPPGQVVGAGCVYPTGVRTLPRQLSHAGLTWRGYMQQMTKPCQHPVLGKPDTTQHATPHHNYAVRHNPFMYFRSITSHQHYCRRHVRPLPDLRRNLRHARTTPNLAYITPDLCRDGHDNPCANGQKGGLGQVDKFLKLWAPANRFIFSKFGAVVWVAVVFLAVACLAPYWSAPGHSLKVAAERSIDVRNNPVNLILLYGVFILVKFIHELGHAFSCRRFGGECHEMGIMFLVFIPTPYVDASTAWAFPNKWHRIFVGAAGMIVELFVASLAAFVWITTGDIHSVVAQLAFNAMLIASVTTIVFNANPLLRYDGYYILSDFLEIPNLRQKSSEYALGLIKRHVFRVKLQHPLPPPLQRFWLFTYAILSSIYRAFVGLVILLIVAYEIPVIGPLMAISGILTWFLVPTF